MVHITMTALPMRYVEYNSEISDYGYSTECPEVM